MVNPVPPLVISADPWVGVDVPLSILDQGLVAAVIEADISQVQRALRLGAYPLVKISRSMSKEHSSALSLCMRHDVDTAKALLMELFTALPRGSEERIKWFQEACSSAGFHAPDPLMEWVVEKIVRTIPVESTGWLWRMLAARRRWDSIDNHQILLLRWAKQLHAYSLAFIFSRAALDNAPQAIEIARWLLDPIKKAGKEDGLTVAEIIIDEISLQMGFVKDLSLPRLEASLDEIARQLPDVRRAYEKLSGVHELSNLLGRVFKRIEAEQDYGMLSQGTLLTQEQAGDNRRL